MTYTIPCEDTPASDGLVVIWPYDLQMDPSTYSSLIQSLHEWAEKEELFYRVYVTRDRFEPDDSNTNNSAEQPVDSNPH